MIITALVLSACNFSSTPAPATPEMVNPIATTTPVPALSMTVNYDENISYNAVDQDVNYNYVIENTSTAPLSGPMTVTDDRVPTVTCPEITTLNAGESITCTGPYKITQLDLNAGSFTSIATASAGGSNSPAVATTVTVTQTRALTLTTKADPLTYNNVGDLITYSYDIKNTGNVTLGPVQFLINDDKFDPPFNCGSDATIIDPNATVFCSRTYTITQADLNAGSVTNTATVTDGTTTSASVAGTINKSGSVPGPGVQHVVKDGEWLWQIARCYGADPRAVVEEFKRKYPLENPAKISPGMIVNVPNVGSQGYNSCVTLHTIQAGETWDSIAGKYSISTLFLQQANPGTTFMPGNVLKVPVGNYP
jgi:LysM repeat protein